MRGSLSRFGTGKSEFGPTVEAGAQKLHDVLISRAVHRRTLNLHEGAQRGHADRAKNTVDRPRGTAVRPPAALQALFECPTVSPFFGVWELWEVADAFFQPFRMEKAP
jgi:hypothetical protein